jgi:hypothetical protein
MHEAAMIFKKYRESYVTYAGKHERTNGQKFRQKPVVLHLGDHDPSGVDMTRDIQERMNLFVGETVLVKRIALTIKQIEELNPPPDPAKVVDPRFKKYQAVFGDESWELDALTPEYMRGLIQSNIRKYLDKDRFAEAVEVEKKDRLKLQAIAKRFDVAVQAAGGDVAL